MPDYEKDLESIERTLARLDDAVDEDILRPDRVDNDAIDAMLCEAGFDPEGVARRGEELARRQLQQDQSWQARARQKLERSRRALDRAPRRSPQTFSREELIARLDKWRSLPGAEHRIQAYFRNKSPEEVSDTELEALLDDLMMLHSLLDPID